jgi:hypothetical protein
MAKQTFTVGQVLTAAQMTSLQQTAMGGGSATAKTASYTLVAADAGTTVIMNSASSTTITVNTALFAAGDTVLIVNQGAGVCTITAGTATVSTAGSLALAQNETGQLYFLSSSAAIFSDYTQGASAPGALTLVKQQTIGSAVSSVTVTSAFSATYDNYLIIVSDGAGSVGGTTSMTLGSTTAAYYMTGFYLSPTGSTVTGFNINNGASWSSTYYTTSNNGGHIILQSPFLSKRTTFQSVLIGADSGSNYAHYMGHLQNTTSYTAFTLTASAATTMTGGEIRVYGYQNS